MRYTLIIVLSGLLFWGCKKDKFTTVPQISFKSIDPGSIQKNPDFRSGPFLTINLTDAEGDFSDTSFMYVKNITIPSHQLDSFPFPVLSGIKNKENLNVDVTVNIFDALDVSGRPRPHIDTLKFEVYVKDNAKNKSNVLTSGPLYYYVP